MVKLRKSGDTPSPLGIGVSPMGLKKKPCLKRFALFNGDAETEGSLSAVKQVYQKLWPLVNPLAAGNGRILDIRRVTKTPLCPLTTGARDIDTVNIQCRRRARFVKVFRFTQNNR
ncbi:hypothetical protein ACEPPX_00475 [Neisseria sp. S1]